MDKGAYCKGLKGRDDCGAKADCAGDVANMLAERGAECDGAFFTERSARDARETKEKRHAAIKYESLSS